MDDKRRVVCGLMFRYVPWNLHEAVKGTYDFDGILDIRRV